MKRLALLAAASIFVAAFGIPLGSKLEKTVGADPREHKCVTKKDLNGKTVIECTCFTSGCNNVTASEIEGKTIKVELDSTLGPQKPIKANLEEAVGTQSAKIKCRVADDMNAETPKYTCVEL